MDADKTDVISILYDRARRAGRPLSAHVELTYRCNLRCAHCYVESGDTHGEMSTDQVRRALDGLARAGVFFVTFTGGEPLLREDFFTIASHAKDNNLCIRIFTNGTRIDADAAGRLAAVAPLEVGVSLYGAVSEIHEAVTRVPGSFEQTTAALGLLTGRGIRTVVKSVLMKQNIEEYGAIIDLAGRLGASYQFDVSVFPRDNGDAAPLACRVAPEQLDAVLSDPRLLPRGQSPAEPHTCRGPVCAFDGTALALSPAGEVFPCLQFKKSFGNINHEPLEEILEKMKKSEIIKRLNDCSQLNVCYNCDIKRFCTRCPGLALLEDGDAFGPSVWACAIARARKRLMENDRG